MDTKIMKTLRDILSDFEDKYYTGKELNKARIIQDIDRYDEELIKAFLDNELIRKHYAKQIGNYTIIETNKLIETFEMDDYWMDSYTKYTKKIGLTTNGHFLDESTDLVLDFPYKDTVLKAGMSKEDVEKEDLMPNEPFFNEVIAGEEIDMLLDKKILVNAKRYTANTVEEAKFFSEEDNLILKGNNLLALHSLKNRYSGKIKLIYLDPPYYFLTKSDDSFSYNSDFKLSTWLTFMKNRLEIAYELLIEGGLICIQMNDHGISYLKVLCDQIYGAENFLNQISVKMSEPTGVKMKHIGKRLPKLKEHILIYKKGDISLNPIKTPKDKWDSEYKTFIKNFTLDDYNSLLLCEENGDLDLADSILAKIEFASLNDIYNELGVEQAEKDEFNINNAYRIVQIASMQGGAKKEADKKGLDRKDVPAYSIISPNNVVYYIKNGYDISKNTPRIKILFAEKYLNVHVGDFWGDIKTTGLDNEGVFEFLNGKKPEKLIQRLINMGTKSGDIILDFFMGSGTTQAVAMKMKRRFIGIEQMDYINTVSVPRLQKVMEGEQGGISKDVSWQGGGSFVYAELMEKSKGYLKDILDASNMEQLNAIYQLMLENVDLDFRADLENVQEMLKDKISLDDKKRLLIKVIDKNQLYYNYSEIDDANIRELIRDSDYAFNQSFYKEED